jgi:hypothetical protein
MDYVAILAPRTNVSAADRDAALARRASWQYPAGITLIAEYWPLSAQVTVVSIFSTDDFGAVMELSLEWNDVFEINIYPATAWDQGLALGGEIFPRLHRLQPSPDA